MTPHSIEYPLISVVMPIYNNQPYLEQAIASILKQTYPHFEFIIVDDGSTDGSTGFIRKVASYNKCIRPLYLSHNGISTALNMGISIARGEWIAFMEADDISLPERLSKQIKWIQENNIDIGGSLVMNIGDENHPIWFPETYEAIRNDLFFRCAILQTTIMMRADIAKSNPFDEKAIFLDYEIWTRLAPHYRMGNLQQVLLKYRRHSQQFSKRSIDLFRIEQRKYRKRYFHTLFPQATAEDYAALNCVVEKEAFPNLSELERAGEWLVRLSQTPDAFLRQHISNKWQASCQRSTQLGLGCFRLYRQNSPAFNLTPTKKSLILLWILCALRIKIDSPIGKFLKSMKRKTL